MGINDLFENKKTDVAKYAMKKMRYYIIYICIYLLLYY